MIEAMLGGFLPVNIAVFQGQNPRRAAPGLGTTPPPNKLILESEFGQGPEKHTYQRPRKLYLSTPQRGPNSREPTNCIMEGDCQSSWGPGASPGKKQGYGLELQKRTVKEDGTVVWEVCRSSPVPLPELLPEPAAGS